PPHRRDRRREPHLAPCLRHHVRCIAHRACHWIVAHLEELPRTLLGDRGEHHDHRRARALGRDGIPAHDAAPMVTGTRLTRGGFRKVPGEHYGTPKEVWGFRTAAARGSPIVIARRFLAANGELFQLEPDLGGLQLRRVIRSLGAAHVIMQQVHAGHRVHRGYVSVHIDRSGRVFLAKNRAMPRRLLPDAFEQRIDRDEAVRRARRSLPERDRRAALRETELLWFPREQTLVPAWKVRLTRRAPRDEWIVYLSARNGAILNRYDNLAEAAVGRAQVFDPSP